MRDVTKLPDGLPIPKDDGAAKHLLGMRIPDLELMTHKGEKVQLQKILITRTVFFIFPRAGNTIQPNRFTQEWDLIPGARGCTPQSCGYRDLYQEFSVEGYQVLGLSAQTPEVLNEVAAKNHLQFSLLSDCEQRLQKALRLPTFDFHGESLIKRMALIIENNQVMHVFYPVFPPDQNARIVLDWIRNQAN